MLGDLRVKSHNLQFDSKVKKKNEMTSKTFKTPSFGNSLAVQWLGLGTFTASAQIQSLVRELRSCKPRGQAFILNLNFRNTSSNLEEKLKYLNYKS